MGGGCVWAKQEVRCWNLEVPDVHLEESKRGNSEKKEKTGTAISLKMKR